MTSVPHARHIWEFYRPSFGLRKCRLHGGCLIALAMPESVLGGLTILHLSYFPSLRVVVVQRINISMIN